MNLSSVKGKSWILKKFNSTDINNYIETFSITEIVAKKTCMVANVYLIQ